MTGPGRPAWLCAGALSLLCLVAAVPVRAASRPPGLTLNPTQGAPLSTVVFSGVGFCGDPACGPVSVTFSGTLVATGVPVDRSGDIGGRFEVPAGPAGSQRVVATQSQANRSATALFFVAPGQPSSGPPGSSSFVPPGATTPTPRPAAVPPPAPGAATPPPQTPVVGTPVIGSTAHSPGDGPVAQGLASHAGSGSGLLPWLPLGLCAGAAIALAVWRRRAAGAG